jgi:hypothetical protein
MKQKLEQILEFEPLDKEIDVYESRTIALYTPPPIKPFNSSLSMDRFLIDGQERQSTLPEYLKPIEQKEAEKTISAGSVIRTQYNLDEKWNLQERFDFSGHKNTEPHINYELVNLRGSVVKDLNDYLKDNHHVDLFKDYKK